MNVSKLDADGLIPQHMTIQRQPKIMDGVSSAIIKQYYMLTSVITGSEYA